jgi:phospholipid/cholesterol/gamma-HCH transport system substrate-binding protein
VLRVQGLTGIAHVELAGGSRDLPLLQPAPGEKYPVIGTGPSLMLRLDTALTTLLDNLNRSSERINALLDDENRAALRQTLNSMTRLSAALADRTGKIDAGLNEATHAMKNTAQAMENTARLADLASNELPLLLQRIQRSADAFDRMSAETARAGASTAGTMESVRAETLPEARLAIAELRELTASLKRFSEELERHPGMLLQGRSAVPPGPGE